MLTPEILIIAPDENQHAQAVYNYLQKNSSKTTTCLLDTSFFPISASWAIQMNPDEFHLSIAMDTETNDIALDKIRSIWWLEPGIPKMDPRIKNRGEVDFAYRECCQALEGMWYTLDCLWVNQPERQEIALNPIYQLQAAKSSGFKIPDTLITSHPPSLLAFAKKHKEKISYRPLLPLLNYTPEPLRNEHLKDIDNLKLAPCLFQECPYFRQQVCVLMIGTYIFSMEVHYQEDDTCIYQKCTIPNEIENKIRLLGKITGLVYMSVEFIIDHQNNYIFYSLDPYYPFLPVEAQTQVPLTESIARLLLGGKTTSTQCYWPTLAWKEKKDPPQKEGTQKINP